MNVLIFGATGGTGRCLVSQGLEQGQQMTALVRNPGALTSENSDLTIVEGDLSDRNSIASALNGANAVMSVLGNKTGPSLHQHLASGCGCLSLEGSCFIRISEKGGYDQLLEPNSQMPS